MIHSDWVRPGRASLMSSRGHKNGRLTEAEMGECLILSCEHRVQPDYPGVTSQPAVGPSTD